MDCFCLVVFGEFQRKKRGIGGRRKWDKKKERKKRKEKSNSKDKPPSGFGSLLMVPILKEHFKAIPQLNCSYFFLLVLNNDDDDHDDCYYYFHFFVIFQSMQFFFEM